MIWSNKVDFTYMFIYTENSDNYKRESATTDDINLLISEGQTSDEIKWHLVSILQIHYFEFMQKYIFLYNRPGNEAISVFNPSMEVWKIVHLIPGLMNQRLLNTFCILFCFMFQFA